MEGDAGEMAGDREGSSQSWPQAGSRKLDPRPDVTCRGAG